MKDHSCGIMISYVGEWLVENSSLTTNKLGVVLINLLGKYHVVISLYYVIILCLCYRQYIPRDASTKCKQCGL